LSFHDVRLPDDIERGASGGPGFKTTVITLASGHEKRNVEWSQQRGRWDIGYGIQSLDGLGDVVDFFYARQGRAFGFRFKDWSDFEITDKQPIGTGDGLEVEFQIFKRYSSGGIDFDRTITKPVSGTVKPFLDGVEQTSGFTVDNTTGIITFDTAPGAGVEVQVECEFDTPVRFDTDNLDISVETFSAGAIPSISIIEIRTP